jgi:hypothetical protein
MIDGFIDFSKQVILGDKVLYVDSFRLKFPKWVRPEHIDPLLLDFVLILYKKKRSWLSKPQPLDENV